MKNKFTGLFLLLINCAIIFINQMINSSLAPLGTSLFLGILLVSFCALCLSYRQGLWVSFFTGLFIDAANPHYFGLTAIHFLWAHCLLSYLQQRFEIQKRIHVLYITQAINALLFIAIQLTAPLAHMSYNSIVSMTVNLILSQLLLALLLFWYLDLQKSLLLILRCQITKHP